MIPSIEYLMLIFFLFSISFIEFFEKKNIVLIILGVVPIIILSSIRWNTGLDWNPYLRLFESLQQFEDLFDARYEFGFVLLNYISKLILDDYSFLLFLTVSVVLFFKVKAFKYFSILPMTALFFNACYYSADLFSNRQAIAIAITLFSLVFIEKREKLKFYFTIFLATTFHFTAIIFISAYKIYTTNLSIKKQIFGVLGAVVFYFSLKGGGYVTIISPLLPGYIEDKLILYSKFAFEDTSVSIFILRALKKIIFLIYFYWIYTRLNCQTYRGIYNVFYASVVLYIVILGLPAPFLRFTMYFTIVEVLLIVYSFRAFKGMQRVLIYLAFVLYGLSKFYYGFQHDHEVLIPYETIFQNNHKIIDYQRYN
ncbi:TPA: hypothetical protein GRI66_05480 [Vibrio parahaemolyticus]|nr:hypothetical protein [Vibrio parahaemolyticus]HAS6850416.1 hypothetical protein [Vibrio parahaemolyticus]HAS6958543.1 hypothetical protein [Vibrio parahaemolyticus]